jgi:hypothetical protein
MEIGKEKEEKEEEKEEEEKKQIRKMPNIYWALTINQVLLTVTDKQWRVKSDF